MRTPLKVIRGLLGIGAVGAVAGGGLVAVLAAMVELITDGTITPQVTGYLSVVGAGLGLAITTAFGVVLAVTSGGRRVEELSFWRATIVSAVVGASLPLALVAIGGDALPSFASGAPAMGICGLFGAFLGGGLVGLGKHSRLRELEATKTDEKLVER